MISQSIWRQIHFLVKSVGRSRRPNKDLTGGAQCYLVLVKMNQNAFQRRSRLCSRKHFLVQPPMSIFFSFPPTGILKNAHAFWILSRNVCTIVSFHGRNSPLELECGETSQKVFLPMLCDAKPADADHGCEELRRHEASRPRNIRQISKPATAHETWWPPGLMVTPFPYATASSHPARVPWRHLSSAYVRMSIGHQNPCQP